MRRKKHVRSRKPAWLKTLARRARTVNVRSMRTRTMIFATIGVLTAAVLIGAATSNVGTKPAAHATPAASTSAPASSASASIPAAPGAVTTPVDEPTATTGVKAAPVTITGCLERNADTFRLKDTAGDNAPKSRSWKSGFLRKGPAPVEVVDASNRVKLASHVGQRVSVTGTLVDREMQVRSLQRVSNSCSASS